ncbi:hypothetical protein [Candidatus Minimicrobia naudis]
MDGRVKSVYSLFKKLDKVGDIDKIYDLIALRIISSTIYQPDIWSWEFYTICISRCTRGLKITLPIQSQMAIKAVHTTVQTPSEKIVEFQIRTKEMHEYAERGISRQLPLQ